MNRYLDYIVINSIFLEDRKKEEMKNRERSFEK